MPPYLSMSVTERAAQAKERADKIAALSKTAKAAFDAASRCGKSISPEMAEAIAKAVLKAHENAPENN